MSDWLLQAEQTLREINIRLTQQNANLIVQNRDLRAIISSLKMDKEILERRVENLIEQLEELIERDTPNDS